MAIFIPVSMMGGTSGVFHTHSASRWRLICGNPVFSDLHGSLIHIRYTNIRIRPLYVGIGTDGYKGTRFARSPKVAFVAETSEFRWNNIVIMLNYMGEGEGNET